MAKNNHLGIRTLVFWLVTCTSMKRSWYSIIGEQYVGFQFLISKYIYFWDIDIFRSNIEMSQIISLVV